MNTSGKRASLLLAGVLIFLLLLPAGAQVFGKNKVQYNSFEWRVYTSEHFELYYYPEESRLASQAILIAEEAWTRLSRLLSHEPMKRVPLVLFSSHPFFQQTNVTPELIGEGTGGFTDIYRSRVVLPFTGSLSEFRHVVAHELVHVFMLDLLFGGIGPQYAMRTLGQMKMPPLWFIEGLAEYLSTGWDSEAESFVADAVASDMLPSLNRLYGGFLVYKEGQALVRYLAEEYGEGILPEILQETRKSSSFSKALRKRLGMDLKELDRAFRRKQMQESWKLLADHEDPATEAFPLREHSEGRSYFTRRPSFSPDAQRMVWFEDHEGEVNLYLASALDGKVIRKLLTGHRSADFESLHPFDSGATFSPEGSRVALLALRAGRDEILLLDAVKGKVLRRIESPLDSMRHPSWSPDAGSILVSGVLGGVTDLWLLDLETEEWSRLTHSLADEQDPVWLNDEEILYAGHESLLPESRIPASPAELDSSSFIGNESIFDDGRGYEIYRLRIGEGSRPLTSTAGDDRDPLPLRGGGYLFRSDVSGQTALWYCDPEERLSRVYSPSGGLLDPSLSPDENSLAFVSLRGGGYDLFILEDLPARLEEAEEESPGERMWMPFDLALDGQHLLPPSKAREADSLVGQDAPYRLRFLIDTMGRRLTFNTLYGLYGSSVISLKDVLGDHEIQILLDVFGRISDSNFLLSYANRKNRINWSTGAYSFLNYYQGTVGALDGTLPEDRLFLEWSRGLWFGGSYPLNLYTRFDADLNLYYTHREYFEGFDLFGDPIPDPERSEENRLLIQPGISLVHDDALFASLGPVKGSRWILGLSRSESLAGDVPTSRWIIHGDWRRYLLGPGGHSLAFRLSGRYSQGQDPLWFHLGGPQDLRGYDYLEFSGTRSILGSVEWRFPFIRYLMLGGPIPFAWGNIGGAIFADFGAAWKESDIFDPWETDEDGFLLRDLHGDIGYGFRMDLGGVLLMWDIAWPMDFRELGDRRHHISIGAQF
ncbi:MAG: hypothetical protein QF492_03750 [Candidatus Krumholzibacteria bacterium]|nr:hypothetical protein [Candidatus Krumholzibacteria bacterium]MDP7021729.1 hypothetical protein [Candidatus Krumholzibacteria bacterium]